MPKEQPGGQNEEGHVEKLEPDDATQVHKAIEELKAEFGDAFHIEETPDEFIITQGERKTHVAKLAEILHGDQHSKRQVWPLINIIEAQIRFPELESSNEQMAALNALRQKPEKHES
jgi:hypothetical protein